MGDGRCKLFHFHNLCHAKGRARLYRLYKNRKTDCPGKCTRLVNRGIIHQHYCPWHTHARKLCQSVCPVLVHAKCGRKRPASNQRNPRKLCDALNCPILAVSPMKHRKYSVHRNRFTNRCPAKYYQVMIRPVRRKHRWYTVRLIAPCVIFYPVCFPSKTIPFPLARDADCHRVVFLSVHTANYCIRRLQGHLVLRRRAAKQDYNIFFIFHLSLLYSYHECTHCKKCWKKYTRTIFNFQWCSRLRIFKILWCCIKNIGNSVLELVWKMLSVRCASQFVGDLCQMKGA